MLSPNHVKKYWPEAAHVSEFLTQNNATVVDLALKKYQIGFNFNIILFAPTDAVFVALLKALNLNKHEFLRLPTVKQILGNHIVAGDNRSENKTISGQYLTVTGHNANVRLVDDTADIPIVNSKDFDNNVRINIIEGILITQKQRKELEEDIVFLLYNEGQNERLKVYADKYGVAPGYLGRYSPNKIIQQMELKGDIERDDIERDDVEGGYGDYNRNW